MSVYGYDARSRQTSVTHKVSNSGSTISSESYVYDAADNLSSKTVDGVTTTYGYDVADQLTSESRTGYSASYAYDANGNRISKTLGGVTQTYTIDDGDKLTAIAQGGVTVKSYTYDAAGRTKTVVTSAGTTTLNYDYESRVTSIVYPSSATNTFSYNGLDARVGKVDSAGTATYRRDGADVTDDVLSDGIAVYTPGVSQRFGGATTYDLSDRLGSATRQTNSSTASTTTRSYDAFGMLLASTGTPKGPFGFAGGHGYQEDADSGLKLLGHRYYDSSTGRFLTRDPISDGRNWYEYCENNPLSGVDPEGLQTSPRVRGPRPGRGGNNPLADEALAHLIDWWLKEQENRAEAERYLKNLESQRARLKEAKREAGIPQAQQPDARGKPNKDGERWYEYKKYNKQTGYPETIIIVVHADGSVHWGRPKPGSNHHNGEPPRYTKPKPTEGSHHLGEPYNDREQGPRWKNPKAPRPSRPRKS